MTLEETPDVRVVHGVPQQIVEKVLGHADGNLNDSLDRLFNSYGYLLFHAKHRTHHMSPGGFLDCK